MNSITIDEAQARLPELIDGLMSGEELVITRGEQVVANLVGRAVPNRPRQFGLGKGKLTVINDDDDHLADFGEYMP
jgi:antitoxin (DNA-binding transcriptional repressor) of toxin-antitoxin stability system